MKRLLRARGIPATLIAIVAVLAGASGGYALAAGSSAITACVSHKGGTLYQAKKCKKHDHKISWSQAGPQGPPGQQGSQGVQGIRGEPGAAGPAGPASTVVEDSSGVQIANGNTGSATASCPSGMVATGGGGVNIAADVYLVSDSPPASTPVGTAPTAWEAAYQNNSGSTVTVGAVVICAPTG